MNMGRVGVEERTEWVTPARCRLSAVTDIRTNKAASPPTLIVNFEDLDGLEYFERLRVA